MSISLSTPGGTGGISSPGGSDKNIQYNDNGTLAGSSRFLWNKNTNQLTVSGTADFYNISLKVFQTSSNYSITTGDSYVLANAASGSLLITLPLLSTVTPGSVFIVKKIDSSYNRVTISGSGSNTIDLNSAIDITQPNDSLSILATSGSNYYIV